MAGLRRTALLRRDVLLMPRAKKTRPATAVCTDCPTIFEIGKGGTVPTTCPRCRHIRWMWDELQHELAPLATDRYQAGPRKDQPIEAAPLNATVQWAYAMEAGALAQRLRSRSRLDKRSREGEG